MTEHYCDVCYQPSSTHHDPEHFPPRCCFGCACGVTMPDLTEPVEIVTSIPQTERTENEGEEIAIGSWWWLKIDATKDKPETKKLVCITHVGSNYVEVESIKRSSWRIHLDEFDNELTAAPDAKLYIAGQIAKYRTRVADLIEDARRVTAELGVVPRTAIDDQTSASTALATAHGAADINAHKTALVLAHDKTLPAIFKKIEEAHKSLAKWMTAETLPMLASLEGAKEALGLLKNRIFTVELYAGLTEEITQIKDGKPADLNAKIHLFQRRHYMDEECLAHYEAGGMEFANLEAFEAWLLRPNNFTRIMPHERSIVAFRVRRDPKHREGKTLSDFIVIMMKEEADKKTFIYIRNGEQCFRLSTAIEFGEQLFPDRDKSTILNNKGAWFTTFGGSIGEIRSDDEHQGYLEDVAAARKKFAVELRAWMTKYPTEEARDDQWWTKPKLDREYEEFEVKRWQRLDTSNVYYDDAMQEILDTTNKHNRVAVVLQGLLDRSPALHPHPQWKIWTAEGFMRAIELVYDDSRAIASGDQISFEAYAAQLRKSIKRGSYTSGQQKLWLAHVQEIEANRRMGSRRYEEPSRYWQPYGNPGPGSIARVDSISRDGKKATFKWQRTLENGKRIPHPMKPGWTIMSYDEKKTATFTCKVDDLFNVSAYTPGDFKLFYSDPRTRADYLKWAPKLLTAENWHAEKRDAEQGKVTSDDDSAE